VHPAIQAKITEGVYEVENDSLREGETRENSLGRDQFTSQTSKPSQGISSIDSISYRRKKCGEKGASTGDSLF